MAIISHVHLVIIVNLVVLECAMGRTLVNFCTNLPQPIHVASERQLL